MQALYAGTPVFAVAVPASLAKTLRRPNRLQTYHVIAAYIPMAVKYDQQQGDNYHRCMQHLSWQAGHGVQHDAARASTTGS
jgi:hypothetical protein